MSKVKTPDFKKVCEKALENRETLSMLKQLMLKIGEYEIAAEVREIELKKFKILSTTDPIYQETDRVKRALKLMGLEVSMSTCYVLQKVIPMLAEVKDHFDLEMASKIQAEAETLF